MKKRGKKNVFRLGLTSLFTDISSEMIFPVLPLFLTTVLNAPMSIVGLIEGIAEATASFLKLASGWFSDKFGKKKSIVIGGYSLSTITKPILAVASHWTHVLGVRFFDRVGKGIRDSPRDALLAASVNKKTRGKSFGLHRALDTTGAIIGTIIAFLLLRLYSGDSFRLIFLLSFIPGVIAVLILIFGVKEKDHKKDHKFKFNFSKLNSNLKKFLFIIVIFNLANFSYAFFLLRAKNIGVLISLIPLIYLVYNLMYAFFSVPAGKISDKIGRKPVLFSGFLLFGLTALGFAFIANRITIWILFGLYGLFMAITEGVSRAFVSDLSNKNIRGTALGTYHMLVGLTVFPANLIGGFLWDAINVQSPFIYAAALSILSSFLLLFLIKNNHKKAM
ncbi:MFS transporter [Candidatus Woesearchaeota archaeon]|nr:MFS transporter [Candidatus Woesearchaeota archaeon]